MKKLRGLDFSIYVRALPVLARNPALLLAPFFMAVIGVLVQLPYRHAQDPVSQITGGLASLIVFLLQCFGLGVSLIIADTAWRRRGTASFDDAWVEARRKAGDILMAALGFNFVVFVAAQIGSFLFAPLGLVLGALALYFFAYTIPAAAIGGIPGGAALQVSIERVQRSYVPTAILVIVSLLVYGFVGWYAPYAFIPNFGLVSSIIAAFFQALALSYVACILSAIYADVSYR